MLAHHLYRRSQPSLSDFPQEYRVGDEFTSEILTNWVLEKKLEEFNLPHAPSLHTAFICNDTGYLLFDSPTLGNITAVHEAKKLKVPLILGILKQLVIFLSVAKDVDFTHNQPNWDVLQFDDEPCSYLFEGHHITCPITLKVTDLRGSSITVEATEGKNGERKKIRLGPKIVIPSQYSEYLSSTPDLTQYHLNDSNLNVYRHLHQLGLPICSSLETYCFLLGLMSYGPFRKEVLNSKTLRRVWTSLWSSPEEETRITSGLEELSAPDLSEILQNLKGISLKEDLLLKLKESILTLD